jgi:FkbM family methyltransferase
MKQSYPSSKILAFEPAPDTFDILRRNLDLHNASDVEIFPFGLSSKATTAKLTYYPKMPGNSTLVPEEKQHIYDEAVRVHGQEAADQFFGDTFKTAQEVDVKLQRLSHFLYNRSGIATIDLLKIDVEGAELEVLRGLDDVHWGLIQNIILEGCETSGTRETIEELLKSKGFSFTREEAAWAPKDFYMIRAYRKTASDVH